jgi:hypothetical protein
VLLQRLQKENDMFKKMIVAGKHQNVPETQENNKNKK